MSKPPFRVEAVLPTPAQPYFLERDSAAFRSLLSKVLKIGQLEFNDLWHAGDSTFVRMITKPEFGSWVPKSVAGQLQSSNLEFHDIIEYNPAYISSPPYRIFVRTESPFLKDKLDIQLTLIIEEVDGGASCRQILEGHIRVKMFGVGRIVESIVKDSLTNTYKKLPEIVRRWQMFREEALRSGDGRQLLLGRPPVGCEVSWIRREVLQILKEPLPEDGTASPVSPLCPVAGASEASEESPAAAARAAQRLQLLQQQQRAAGVAEAEAVFSAAEAAAARRQQQQQQLSPHAVAAEEQLDDLRAGRRYSVATEYYDARDGPCAEEDASSAIPEQLQQQVEEAEAPPGLLPAGTPAQAAAALARGARHRRGLSMESATSTDTPTTEGGQSQAPGSRRFWRRFNRNYGEWETYWETVGVEHEAQDAEEGEGGAGSTGTPPGGVVGRALHAVEELMRDSYYSTSILVALFLMRRGWLRVEPDADASTHDEEHRRHDGHRHRRSGSSGAASAAAEPAGGLPPPAASGRLGPGQPQSLARVAQEVCSRMVSGPRKAVAAAGSGLRQASLTGAKAIMPSRTRSTSSDADGLGELWSPDGPADRIGAVGQAGAGGLPGHAADELPKRHRKTMSLDTGTAVAAREAAAAAMLQQAQAHRAAGASGTPPLPPGWTPTKPLGRRPSDLASATAMDSMQRAQNRVRAPSRLSCFGACRRAPAVKD